MLIEGDYDLLSGIRLISLPGHTPGTMGVMFETKNGSVILAGDAIYSEKNYGPPVKLPGIVASPVEVKSSIEKVRHLSQTYKAMVVFGHSPKQYKELPIFPKWSD